MSATIAIYHVIHQSKELGMRKLATVRRVKEVKTIDGSANIDLAIVDGWQCVVKKGEFSPGDLCVYCEIDSFLPMTKFFEFLRPRGVRKMADGTEGHRLKTVKLRGCISQGLLLPIMNGIPKDEGLDVTKELGIKLYEPPIPAALNGEVKGVFPGFIQKTDEERIQNLLDYFENYRGHKFVVTEKLDGTSFTAYLCNGEFGVCSRNLEFKLDTENENTFLRVARHLNIEEKLRSFGKNIAIQGELIGEGIQGNRYNIKGQTVRFFTVFDIDRYCPLKPKEKLEFLANIGLESVPLITEDLAYKFSIERILEYAEGISQLANTQREGLVFRSQENSRVSFKVISNKFLLKGK